MKKQKVVNVEHKSIINRIKVAIIVLICVTLCILQLFSLIKRDEYDKYTLTKNVVVKHNGKKVFKGNIDEYKMKGVKSEDNLTMYMTIPKNKLKSPAIMYDNINTAVKIYVDKKEVYSIGEKTPKGGIVCHAFNKASLGDITDKKEVVMSVRVMNDSTLTRLPRVYMMNTYEIDEDYYYSMHIYILIGYYLATIGMLGLVMVSFLWKRNNIMNKMLVLSATCIVGAIYMIAMFQVIPLFSDNYIADTFFEYGARMYFPMMLNAYMLLNYPKGKRKPSMLLTLLSGTHATIALILQALRIMYVNDTMEFCLFMYVCTGINIVAYYVKYKKTSISKKTLVGMSVAVLALVSIYVIVHIFFSNYSDYFLVVVPMAIVVVLTIFYMELIGEIASNIVDDAKKKALQRVAYLDGLTRIANRRGLEMYLEERINKDSKYKLYSFDLNKLKFVNDNYGHAMGDEYIRTFAEKLKLVFEKGFCARLGGDEFVAIMDVNYKEKDVMDVLAESVNEYNSGESREFELAYSVGVADYTPGKDDVEEVMKKADEEMYKMKGSKR